MIFSWELNKSIPLDPDVKGIRCWQVCQGALLLAFLLRLLHPTTAPMVEYEPLYMDLEKPPSRSP